MASGSLGTLTLDLAVRLSEFTDGLTRAERQARDSAGNISDSVSELRDNIADDISKISGSFAGMAIGGLAVAAGAMAALAIETAKADVQLGIMAGTANTSLKSFQVLTHAAAGFGVEQEALGAILADTQEKLGEFSATGGGGAADFMEALQNNTKMTDEQIRELGKTLQGKDGVGAIQYLKDELDALGATSQEQRFIMESLAGDLGNLMPLFANGGAILEEYGVQLTDAGVIKTAEAIEQSRILAAQTQAMQTQFEGLKTQLVASTIPAMSTLITYFQEGSQKGRGFKNEVNGVGEAVRVTTGLIIGLAASVSMIAQVFQGVGAQMRAIGQTTLNFVEADGVIAKSKALVAGTITMAGMATVSMRSISDEYDRAVRAFEASSSGQQNRLTGLAAVQYEANNFLQSNTSGLAINTVEKEANTKAEEARAKALEKTTKAAGSAAKAQERLVGISGDTGIGSAHLHVQYRDKNRAVSAADLARFQVGGKNITDYRKTSGYGPRNTGIKGASTYHRGTDYGVPKNTPITTSVPVKNVKTWLDKKGGGYVSTITFGDGVVIDLLHQMPGIMGIEKGETTGNNQIDGAIKKADAMWQKSADDAARAQEKAAADAIRAQEETLRKQASVAGKWAYEKEKIELDYQKNVAEVKESYAEGSADYIKYMARVEEDYTKAKNAGLLSITEKYFSEEQKIHDDHKKAIAAIEKEFVEGDPNRVLFVDLQNAAYKEDLDNFRFASQAKAREQDKMYQSIANSIKANRLGAASTGLDAMAQRTMSGQDYEVWRLAQDHDESFDSVNGQYAGRQNEINARDDRGDFLLPELERNELLEAARQEHLDAMWSMEQEFALKQQQLDEQQRSARIEMYQGLFSGLAGLTKSFFGEQSAAHRLMFGIEKGFAIAQSALAIQQAVAKAMSVGFPANLPLIGAAVAQGANIMSNISSITAPVGQAHDGIMSVPKSGTWNLEKGEQVLPEKTAKAVYGKLTDSSSGVTINNYSSAKVEASSDGKTITITDVRNEVKRGFTELQNPNSHNAKMVKSSFNTTTRR